MKKLKIVHLSTSSVGGAAIAAKALNRGLRARGIDSEFWSFNESVNDGEFASPTSTIRKVTSKFATSLSIYASKDSLMTPVSCRTIRYSNFKSLKPESTVLHIHNWFNMLSEYDFLVLQNMGFRIVFTAHDERLYTGGCHYSLGCNKFASGCIQCPQTSKIFSSLIARRYRANRKIFEKFDGRVPVICPSEWIEKRATIALDKSHFKIHKISNFISAPIQSDVLLNWSSENISLGIASMLPFSYIKGGAYVKELLSFAAKSEKSIEVRFLLDESKQSDFWESIDYLLIPSKSDNSPNVIHEAKRLGIPFAGFKVGGIPELTSDMDIMLEEEEEINSLIFKVKTAKKTFSRDFVISNTLAHYENLLGDPISEIISIYESMFN